MAQDFRKYLAVEIVSEKRTVSYRTVARALKVHVNAAKCMLYEFYQHETAKKPGSIYATYMLAGIKKGSRTPIQTHDNANANTADDNSPPPSSPPPFTSSMLEPSQEEKNEDVEERYTVPVRTITVVREESLETMKEQYEAITSIHLYSLSPARLPDLVTLTDISRDLFSNVFVKEDPLLHNQTYGVIQNPDVRRRKGKRPAGVENTALTAKAKAIPKKEEASTTSKAPTLKKEPSRPGSSGSLSSNAGGAGKPAPLKRDASDIFKSFAKAKPQPKANADSQEDTNSAVEDTSMADAPIVDDEGESEDEALFLDTNTRKPASKKRTSDVKKDRDDKAAKLRRMMDSDDESGTHPATPKVEEAPAPLKDEDGEGEKVAWSDSDTEKQPKSIPAEAVAAAGPARRRRARRKVMKKRTMKDEDGYLVTREEAVWESFSEDELPPVPKPKVKVEMKSGKGGKATGGGGGIMNFFGKK